jgi:spore maturation protein CgeB
MGICTINWYCNASYQFELVEEIAPAYDYCLVPEKFRLDAYRRVGAKPIYCQEAANPKIYKPYNIPQSFDVTFVGQRYGDRPAYIRALLDAGIDVRVWGPSWKASGPVQRLKKLTTVDGWRKAMRKVVRKMDELSSEESNVDIPREICGHALSDEDLIKMYSRSKISLGFSSCGETHEAGQRILQVRLRDFEAPMSGAFYMVEYMEELEEFYQIGKEIVCYHDKDDLADKAQYYLKHDVERERIRLAGYQRAVNEHSWQKRFEYVFREIGLIR